MAHKGHTQTASDSVPKIPHTIRLSSGVFYVNFRNPDRLVKAGVAPSLFRKSLGTRDWREAKSKVAREVAFRQAENDRLLQELDGRAGLHVRANASSQPVPLSSLSDDEQRALILEWFVAEEGKAEKAREQFREASEDERDVWLDTARVDLAACEGNPVYAPIDWVRDFQSFLKARGLTFDRESSSERALQLFKKAVVESQWRTVADYEGRRFATRDPAFQELHSRSEVETSRVQGHTIREICERFPQRKREGKLSKATLTSYALPIRVLEQFFSPSRPLSSLRYEDGEALIRFLATVPVNAAKRFKGVTLREAAEIEAKREKPQVLSPKRQEDVLTTIKAILQYAVEMGWIERNPFSSGALLDNLPKVNKRDREQFTADDLNRLFHLPRFLDWRGATDGKGTRTEGRFWVPLLGMFLGVRANEAASLLVQDVKEENGIPFLWIRETDDAGNQQKHLKTEASERKVPLHQELIRIGFLAFVRAQRETDPKGFLFPEMTPCAQTGNRAKAFSQWFGRLRQEALGEATAGVFGKDFHSFRHSVTDCLRKATESDEKRFAVLGWTEGTGKRNAGYDYGSGFPLDELKRLVDQISYPGFDPSFLYPTRQARKRLSPQADGESGRSS